MTTIRMFLAVAAAAAIASPTASAQSSQSRSPHFDAKVMVGIPVGSGSDALNSGGGVAGSLLFPIGDGPLQLGFDVGLMSFSSASVPVQPSTALLTGLLQLRIQPADGTVRPFVDLLLGTNQMFVDNALPGGSSYDFGLGFGAGAGVDVIILDEDSDLFLKNLEATGGLRLTGSSLSFTPGLPTVGGGAVGSQSFGSWMVVPQLGLRTKF